MGNRASATAMFNGAVNVINAKATTDYQQQAYQLFASACMADPTWAEAYYQSGNNNGDLNLFPAAIACYRRALECEPNPDLRAKILTNMGWRLHCIGKSSEALQVSTLALHAEHKSEPETLSAVHVNLSCIFGIYNKLDEAELAAREAFRINPTDSTCQMALAFALLFNRKFKEGFEQFEGRFKYKLKEYLQYPYPKWDGAPDKTLYLCADQGLGDTISFARFVHRACEISKYVHMRVQPELVGLFTHAFIGKRNLNIIPQPCPYPTADAWTTFVSLPHNLNLSDEEIRNAPHIEIPKFASPPSWLVSDRRLHIGIAWGGSPLNDIDKYRNIPVHHFLDLYRVPGIQLYSLQVGDKAKDMHDIGAAPFMVDLSRYIMNVSDTLGLLSRLDMAICVESALGHICALANKECWIPYSHFGRDYRIGCDGKDAIWTPRHRFFQQGKDARWEPVFERIVDALMEKVHGR